MKKQIIIKNHSFTLINKNTKRGESIIDIYNYYFEKRPYAELYHVYDNYSIYKERAFDYCIKVYDALEGYNRTITGSNCMTFSFAFLAVYDNKKYLIYITKGDDYAIEL